MKLRRNVCWRAGVTALILCTSPLALADPPDIIHHQGRIAVDGVNVDGTGYFKFALVDGGTENVQTAQATAEVTNGFITAIQVTDGGNGYLAAPGVAIEDSQGPGSGASATATVQEGMVTSISVDSAGSDYDPAGTSVLIDPPPPASIQSIWSHDGSSSGGSEPASSLALLIVKGHYHVALGDTEVSGMTQAVTALALQGNPSVALRIWFATAPEGPFLLLSPDQRLGSAGYSLVSEVARSIKGGTLDLKAPDGSTSNRQIDHTGGYGIFRDATGAGFDDTRWWLDAPDGGEVVVGPRGGDDYLDNLRLRSRAISIETGEGGLRIVEDASGKVPNMVAGSRFNSVASGIEGSTIAGGGSQSEPNSISGSASFATIGGGSSNASTGSFSVIGGGIDNETTSVFSTIGGGQQNRASSVAGTIAGGRSNWTFGDQLATIGGGEGNSASGYGSTIGGGQANSATGSFATVGGGNGNSASGVESTVPGGRSNSATGANSFAAGRRAQANHPGSFVWADSTNAPFASIQDNEFAIRASGGVRLTGGNFLLPDPAGSTSHRQIDFTGGYEIYRDATGAGTHDTRWWLNAPDGGEVVIGPRSGSDYLGNLRLRSMAISIESDQGAGAVSVAGHVGVSGNVTFGNESLGTNFKVYGTTRCGTLKVDGPVGIGSWSRSVNSSSALHITRGGETPPGPPGPNDEDNGLLIGSDGWNSYKWIQSYAGPLVLNWRGQNVGIGRKDPSHPLHMGSGAYVTSGGTWTNASDKNRKSNFARIDTGEMLERVVALPVTRWNYDSDPEAMHVGPMAQDFHAAFGLGVDDKHISTVDADGVAFAAIQGLNKKLEKSNQSLKSENAQLKTRVSDLEARLERLEAALLAD